MNYPLVSVLVLNYNGKRFLDDCFDSVLNSTYSNFEVYLIDNASTEDDVSYVQAKYPQVKIFVNEGNLGYSHAYNNAITVANGKYLVLLNNDTKVDSGWLDPLVEEAEKDSMIGACQPKLLCLQEPERFEYAGGSGGFIDKYAYPFVRGRIFYTIEKDEGQYNDNCETFWCSGAALFVRSETINKCGGLDLDFVHHMEEIDMCYRFNLAGYTMKSVPSSIVYHYGGATISYESFKKLYWNHRNSIFMLLKNLEGKNILKILFVRLMLDVLTIGWSITKFDFNRGFAIIKAHLWLLFHINMIVKKRKDIKKLRIVSDKEIFSKMYPKSVAIQYFLKKKDTYSKLMKHIN